jgi:hypothetical protein
LFTAADGSLKRYSRCPSTLLTAMWLQFHRLVTGERRFRTCDICKRLMDVTDNQANKRVHQSCSLRERARRLRERRRSCRRNDSQPRARG